MITDTHPTRIMAYALHDTFGYDERWSTDEGAQALINELDEKGIVVMTRDEFFESINAEREQARLEVYEQYGD